LGHSCIVHAPLQLGGTTGHIALRLPLPPGCLPMLGNDDEGFVRA
jgi:hypothetical protein